MSLQTPNMIRVHQRKLNHEVKQEIIPRKRRLRSVIFSVCPTVKPVGEPDAGNPHVRFDERGWETERCRMAQATAPILDSTKASEAKASILRQLLGEHCPQPPEVRILSAQPRSRLISTQAQRYADGGCRVPNRRSARQGKRATHARISHIRRMLQA